MKLEIIETTDYVLAVSDEEIRDVRQYKGKYHIEKGSVINIFPDYLTDLSECKLIKAYQPKGDAPELDLPLLPEMGVEDDVEKLADEVIKKEGSIYKDAVIGKQKWIEGYKAATKVYSEDDLRKAIEVTILNCFVDTIGYDNHVVSFEGNIDEIIQSLKQSKTPKWFVAETKTVKGKYIGKVQIGITPSGEPTYIREGYEEIQKFKTTTTNGKTYLVGTYLNE